MATRPELVLLQKTMVVVEGVARTLDPQLDMWATAEPVVGDWIAESGPLGRIEDVRDGFAIVSDMLSRVPALMVRVESVLAEHERERARPRRSVPRWLIILALAVGIVTALTSVGGYCSSQSSAPPPKQRLVSRRILLINCAHKRWSDRKRSIL